MLIQPEYDTLPPVDREYYVMQVGDESSDSTASDDETRRDESERTNECSSSTASCMGLFVCFCVCFLSLVWLSLSSTTSLWTTPTAIRSSSPATRADSTRWQTSSCSTVRTTRVHEWMRRTRQQRRLARVVRTVRCEFFVLIVFFFSSLFYFLFLSGKESSLTTDSPLQAKTGEHVRVYFGNAGPNLTSSFHIIGAIFEVTRSTTTGSTRPPLEHALAVPVGAAAASY